MTPSQFPFPKSPRICSTTHTLFKVLALHCQAVYLKWVLIEIWCFWSAEWCCRAHICTRAAHQSIFPPTRWTPFVINCRCVKLNWEIRKMSWRKLQSSGIPSSGLIILLSCLLLTCSGGHLQGVFYWTYQCTTTSWHWPVTFQCHQYPMPQQRHLSTFQGRLSWHSVLDSHRFRYICWEPWARRKESG